MNRPLIVGVMGGGEATPADCEIAYKLGRLIAQEGWILLNGGRNTGVMEASAKGAWDQGGITLGILPDSDLSNASAYVKIPVLTGMGSARNTVNVLTSNIVVACPGGAGTLSEIALALKHHRKVILLNFDVGKAFERFSVQGLLHCVETPEEVIELIKQITGVAA